MQPGFFFIKTSTFLGDNWGNNKITQSLAIKLMASKVDR